MFFCFFVYEMSISEGNASKVMGSNPAHQPHFIFQLEIILRSNLNFSSSYRRSIDLKIIITEINMAWRKKNH